MARQPDVQYVRFYTAGSTARKLELPPEKKKKAALPQPKVRREKQTVIHVDPISLFAMLVAGVMLVAMAIGMIELGSVNAEADRMEAYVAELQSENAQLHAAYESGYDLEDVEQKALGMGLVPMDEVEHVTIHVEAPQTEAEPTFWEEVGAFLSELFA